MGAGGPYWGVLGGRSPPSNLTGNNFSIHGATPVEASKQASLAHLRRIGKKGVDTGSPLLSGPPPGTVFVPNAGSTRAWLTSELAQRVFFTKGSNRLPPNDLGLSGYRPVL